MKQSHRSPLKQYKTNFGMQKKTENEYKHRDGLHAAPAAIDTIIINTQGDSSDDYTSYESSSSADFSCLYETNQEEN